MAAFDEAWRRPISRHFFCPVSWRASQTSTVDRVPRNVWETPRVGRVMRFRANGDRRAVTRVENCIRSKSVLKIYFLVNGFERFGCFGFNLLYLSIIKKMELFMRCWIIWLCCAGKVLGSARQKLQCRCTARERLENFWYCLTMIVNVFIFSRRFLI